MKIPVCLILALACLACGLEQDISFDEPEASPPEGPSLTVLWGGNEMEVFLDDLDRIVDQDVYLLWDILLVAGLEEEDIFSMRFDFEGEDGFRPSSVGCDPLDGEILDRVYLDPEGMALLWDLSLGLRGCYGVTRTARILGESAEPTVSPMMGHEGLRPTVSLPQNLPG
jgi:hypothetical protein